MERIRLKTLPPVLKAFDRAAAPVAAKHVDAFYQSTEWRETRKRVLLRDAYRCTMPGCRKPAAVVDHRLSRRNGGTDDEGNLRSLCRDHDNRYKEDALGNRRGSRSGPGASG